MNNLLPQTVFEVNSKGRIMFANPQALKLFGYDRDDYDRGLSLFQLVVFEQRERVKNLWHKVEGGETVSIEVNAVAKDGHTFHVLVFLTPIGNQQNANGIKCLIVDISEYKEDNNELRSNASRFRDAFDHAPIGMALVDLDDKILHVNQALCNMLGYPQDQLVSRKFAEFTYWGDGSNNKTIKIKQNYKIPLQEKKYVHASGKIIWVQINVSIVADDDKNPLYVVQQVQDITERKRVDNLHRIRGNRLRAFLENGTDVISLIDTDGTITYSSPSTERVLGYSSKDYIGANFFEMIHQDDRNWVNSLFAELVPIPGKRFNSEFRYKHEDGTWRWIELTATNSIDEEDIGGIIANYRDITDNRIAQDAIQIRAAQQSVLAQISQRALIESDLSGFMAEIIDQLAETLSVEYCMILELQPDGKKFLLRAGIGWNQKLAGIRLMENSQETMAGYTLSSHTPVLMDNLKSEKRFIDQMFFVTHGAVSGVSVVIEGRERAYGVLGIFSSRRRSFSQNDVNFLQALANVLSATMGSIQADEALRKSEERYMLVATSANDGLWDWDLKFNSIYYSPRWKEMLGYGEDEIKNNIDEWLQRLHPDDSKRVGLALSPSFNTSESRFEIEFRIRHRDNSYRWVLTRGTVILDAEGVAYRMAGSLTDITERKMAEQQLHFDAFHDPLTGLSNRAYFMERLTHVIRIAKRKRDYRFAVLFLDLDEFKVVNDRYGHDVGDRFLKEVASRLSSFMRSMDTLARLGGDEFVILLEDIHEIDEATQVAERILSQLSEVFEFSDIKITTSASIGIVYNDFNYEKSEDVLRDADIAMYKAKALGKAKYVVFSTTLREQTIARLEREVDLMHALERKQFRIYYQPIYSFVAKMPIGVEALLRWKHPSQGLVMPSEFIKIAEESNLILPIDCFVLHEACLQIQQWEKTFSAVRDWNVHVNLSSKNFIQLNLVDIIQNIIQETGFSPTRVNLEITESAIMENIEQAMITIQRLREIGFHISIDDFGTGYSSLNYLTRFPVDLLKLDQSFVPRIITDRNTREIIDTVIKLASKLNIRVVAEGVETVDQLRELQALGCEYGQGHLFSKAVNRDVLTSVVDFKS